MAVGQIKPRASNRTTNPTIPPAFARRQTFEHEVDYSALHVEESPPLALLVGVQARNSVGMVAPVEGGRETETRRSRMRHKVMDDPSSLP